MKIAVLSLTRDRLDYTRHCFDRLHDLAGCDFDHYVLDQGSTDATDDYLDQCWGEGSLTGIQLSPSNLGIHRGMNLLLDMAGDAYDVIVKFDNDCELTSNGTLRRCAEAALAFDALVSPEIHGLRGMKPPFRFERTRVVGREQLGVLPAIGGIFMAMPATLFSRDGYRFNESAPVWGTDDQMLCAWWREQGRDVGYLVGLRANHYETTDGQHDRFPDYFERRVSEGGPE